MRNSNQSSPQWLKKETVLAKAVSITKRHKKGKSSPPNKKTGPQTIHFFQKRLPGKYGDRRDKNFQPYTQYAGQNRDTIRGPYLLYNQTSYQQYNRPGQKLLFHKPQLPASPLVHNPNRESIRGPTPDSAPKSGDISRQGYRKTGSSMTCGSQTSAFPPKLASQNQ